jgi:hypothetical protein
MRASQVAVDSARSSGEPLTVLAERPIWRAGRHLTLQARPLEWLTGQLSKYHWPHELNNS